MSQPGTVLAGAIMTCVGGGAMVVAGLMFAFGTGDGRFLGQPVERVGIAGTSVAVGALAAVGVALAAVGVLLIVLAVLARRGSDGARVGLTAIGAVFAVVQLFSLATGDAVSSILPLLWIGTAVTLLWIRPLPEHRPEA